MLVVSWYLAFRCFSLSDSRCMSNVITGTKLEQTGEIFCDSRCCLCARVSVLSLVHESEMRGYLVNVLIVKYLPY